VRRSYRVDEAGESSHVVLPELLRYAALWRAGWAEADPSRWGGARRRRLGPRLRIPRAERLAPGPTGRDLPSTGSEFFPRARASRHRLLQELLCLLSVESPLGVSGARGVWRGRVRMFRRQHPLPLDAPAGSRPCRPRAQAVSRIHEI